MSDCTYDCYVWLSLLSCQFSCVCFSVISANKGPNRHIKLVWLDLIKNNCLKKMLFFYITNRYKNISTSWGLHWGLHWGLTSSDSLTHDCLGAAADPAAAEVRRGGAPGRPPASPRREPAAKTAVISRPVNKVVEKESHRSHPLAPIGSGPQRWHHT